VAGGVNPGSGDAPRARFALPKAWREDVLLPFTLERTVLVLVVLGATQLFREVPGFHTELSPLVDMWIRWDALHYLDVAAHGYGGAHDAFFPLYPWLVRTLGWAMPLPLAAVIVAQGATVGACVALYAWARDDGRDAEAARSVWLLLLFPTSFFLGAAYAESTYLLFSIATFLAYRRGDQGYAATFAFLACLARPQGFLCMTVPFGVAWLVESRRLRTFPFFTFASLVALAVLALAHYRSSGDPFGFLHGETLRGLGRFRAEAPSDTSPPPAWEVLWDEGLGRNLPRRLLNWSALALAFAGGAALLRRRRIAEGLLCWLTVGVPLYFHASILDAASMARYVLLAFPLFPLLAEWTREGIPRRVVDLAFPMTQVVLFSLYVNWYWAE